MPETITPDQVLDAVSGWTLLQVKEFVDKFEEKFDVTAAAAPVMMAGPAGGGAAAAPVEEKTEFTVVLKEVAADKKIKVIKEVRAILTDLGLKEAKDLVDSAPKDILKDVGKEEAEKAKKQLEDAGAVIEIK
jgi:large subunit ribosomal protein L7/L12